MRPAPIKTLALLTLFAIVAYFGRSFILLARDYLSPEVPKAFLFMHVEDLRSFTWRFALYVHIFATLSTLLSGPFLFFEAFRNRYLQLHRQLGQAYVVAILCAAAPSGMILSFYALHGWRAGASFFMLSIVWGWTAYHGLSTIRRKDLHSHQRWMIRSYALTLAAITQRLWSQKLGMYIDQPATTYIAGAWLGWTINLCIAETAIRLFAQTKRNRVLVTPT